MTRFSDNWTYPQFLQVNNLCSQFAPFVSTEALASKFDCNKVDVTDSRLTHEINCFVSEERRFSTWNQSVTYASSQSSVCAFCQV